MRKDCGNLDPARPLLCPPAMWTLARKILLHDKVKFTVAAAGVSISVLLVLVQIGLYLGFMGNASNLIDHAHADIWITGKGTDSFDFATPIDDRFVYRVAEVPGVARVEKLILSFGQFKLPSGGTQGVQIVGIEHDARLIGPWNVVSGDVRHMNDVDGIVVDQTEFDKLHIDAVGVRREITGVRAHVVGLTKGIRNFTHSPYVFTNLASARAYTRMNADQITYILVKAAPGVNLETLRDRLRQLPNLDAYTSREFSQRTRKYWSSRTGVGTGFFTTAIIGIIVGLVIVGQILYNGTLEHIHEYGTMKAMGAANGTIVRVIMYQALISAVVGFVVGGALSFLAGRALQAAHLTVNLTPTLLVGTAVLTAGMCMLAATLSILKVLKLDPAMVFKG